MMPLQKLQFRPGIVRDLTGYTNEGGWRISNLVRFRYGFPETIGGWMKNSNEQFLGTCRSLLNWTTLSGDNILGMGTHLKYYIERGGGYNDITPLRSTVVLSNPFTATTGLSVINVYDVAHGCTDGDFVTFSGAVSLGGNVTAAILNRQYQITYINADNFSITVSVVANASDSGNGGSSVTAAYQINTGLDTQVGGTGWGAGTWSRGAWGSATTLSVTNTLRLWSQDNYGEDLIFNVRSGGLYYWDATGGYTTRGVTLASLSTDPTTPTLAIQVMVSDRDRHVVAFGANQGGSTALDPLSIRFASQEDPFTWTPTATNTAGDLRLGSGSQIVRAVETKREILVFTEVALYSMQYVGPPYTFGIQMISNNISINGYNSAVAMDDTVFWMGDTEFYVYTGATNPLLCPLKDYVFNDFNFSEKDKVYAALSSEYNEVTWFYPSANSFENDRYVTFNYLEKVWTYGMMARTAWLDHGVRQYPQATGPDNYLYNHEFGTDDGSTTPATPLNAYIESSPVDIGEGDVFSFVRRILPDVTFSNSSNGPRLDMIIKTQNYPGSNYQSGSSSEIVRTAVVPVEQYTQVKDIRLRGRSLILRVESNRLGTCWRLGSPRIEIQPDGRR
jgi:hypothetical protein